MERKIIRNYVKEIHTISQSLDAMMELNDRNYNVVSYIREKEELKALLNVFNALSEYIRVCTDGTGL